MQIAIIDYNTGNIGSVVNMLKKIGVQAELTRDTETIQKADKLILPGVGHFDYGMRALHQTGLVPILNDVVLKEKRPILGICLGAQLLTEYSEEGTEKGLGWIKAGTKKFQFQSGENKKLPNMGWMDVSSNPNSKLFKDMYEEPRFYFVHTYHMVADNQDDVMVTANYGYDFAAGLEKENVMGVQFHPEKSHKFGKKLLENFINEY